MLILYSDRDGEKTESDPRTPWTKTIDRAPDTLQLSAFSIDGNDVTCSIKVDGKVVADEKGVLAVCVHLGS